MGNNVGGHFASTVSPAAVAHQTAKTQAVMNNVPDIGKLSVKSMKAKEEQSKVKAAKDTHKNAVSLVMAKTKASRVPAMKVKNRK